MRLEETVKLDDNRVVIVREMTVGEVRKLLRKFLHVGQLDWLTLLVEHFEEVTALLSPNVVSLSNDETFEDLTWSDLMKLWKSFGRLNPFFQTITSIVQMLDTLSPEQLKQLIPTAAT
ncbi:MAG: hypothetical protein B6247_04025 [Candidatus Parabeggiatoa sp. nov. 2]|nr:MAG: hypothetical protein B6247_04025 [Beggiatoa sp. 4572_84]